MNNIRLTIMLLFICVIGNAQTLYVPSGTSGIGTSSTSGVGIGNSSPLGNLHIKKSVNDVNQTTDLVMSQFNGYSKISGLYTGLYLGGITFSTNNNSSGENDNNIIFQERMRITSDGKVGIGSASPLGMLHIRKSVNDVNQTTDLVMSQFNGHSKISGLYSGTFMGGITFSTNNNSSGENDNNIIFQERMRIASDGKVGIGTTSPQYTLDVNGAGNFYLLKTSRQGVTIDGSGFGNPWAIGKDNTNGIYFYEAGSVNQYRMIIKDGGNVGIGNTNPDAKLTVSGQVHAQEVKVTVNAPGPDYVFEKDYSLPSLDQIKTYIEENKHLPEVPSAKEMEKNGVQLGEMNMLLLKKIEELTLYVLEQQKEIAALNRFKERLSNERDNQLQMILQLKKENENIKKLVKSQILK
jgi:hypothetical protein